jgi:hypothetical protein
MFDGIARPLRRWAGEGLMVRLGVGEVGEALGLLMPYRLDCGNQVIASYSPGLHQLLKYCVAKIAEHLRRCS